MIEDNHDEGKVPASDARLPGVDSPGEKQVYPPFQAGEVSKEERNWALAAHVSTLSTFIGIPGFIGPLIVWLVKKDELHFASSHAKEALNFQISLFAYAIALTLLFLTIIGALIAIPGLIALGFVQIIFAIIASIKAGEGKPYRYPMTFRLVE